MRYPDGGGLTAKQRAQREQVRFEAAALFAQGVAPSLVARRLRVPARSHTPGEGPAAGSGRISLAGLVCCRSGHSTRLIFRMLVHHRKGERKGFREQDFARLLDAAHQQLGGPVVLVRDNYTHHVDTAMREVIAARTWLTVFRFPSYTPDLNPAEGVWAHLKHSLGNLAPCSLDELAALARTHLKRMQYQPGLLQGFITQTGLTPVPP
ncbi:transposase [Streptomyces aureoversilis]|uniref:Transposase n=1 Tax=Streptomyces aureoversilis TaxID=67277 RepID=A0ABW0AC12_9ACTN